MSGPSLPIDWLTKSNLLLDKRNADCFLFEKLTKDYMRLWKHNQNLSEFQSDIRLQMTALHHETAQITGDLSIATTAIQEKSEQNIESEYQSETHAQVRQLSSKLIKIQREMRDKFKSYSTDSNIKDELTDKITFQQQLLNDKEEEINLCKVQLSLEQATISNLEFTMANQKMDLHVVQSELESSRLIRKSA